MANIKTNYIVEDFVPFDGKAQVKSLDDITTNTEYSYDGMIRSVSDEKAAYILTGDNWGEDPSDWSKIATEDYVDQKISEAGAGGGSVDLTGYATEAYVDSAIRGIEGGNGAGESGLIEGGNGDGAIQHKNTSANSVGAKTVALGDATSGIRGYRICGIDFKNRKITVTSDDIKYLNPKDTVNYTISETARDGYIACIKVIDTNGNQVYPPTFPNNDIARNNFNTTIDGYVKPTTLGYNSPAGKELTVKFRAVDCDNITKIASVINNKIKYDLLPADAATSIYAGQDPILCKLWTEADGTFENGAPDGNADTWKKVASEITTPDTYQDRFSFSIQSQPTVGSVIIGETSFAVGAETVGAFGRYSFAGGRKTYARGDAAFAFGDGVEAGYRSFAAGESCKVGERTYGIGQGCENYSQAAFVTGGSNKIKPEAKYAFVSGYSNETSTPFQTIVGVGSTPVTDAAFIVGNATTQETDSGTIINSRSNALVVYKDGRAAVGKAPENDMDVVTLGSLPVHKGVDNSIYAGKNSSTGAYGHSVAIGHTVKTLDSFSVAFGEATQANTYGFAAGRNTLATGYASNALGFFTQAVSPYQTVIGLYNEPINTANSNNLRHNNIANQQDSAVFIVGNGGFDTKKNEVARSNAFVVHMDGRATIGKDPTKDMDVSSKKYVDSSVESVENYISDNMSYSPALKFYSTGDTASVNRLDKTNNTDAHIVIPKYYKRKLVTEIEPGAFYGVGGITDITIPNSITRIADGAFYNFIDTATIYFDGTVTEWEKISIGINNGDVLNINKIVFLKSDVEGFKFTKSDEGAEDNTCTVAEYYGDNSKVIVPYWYQGFLTREIGESAFYRNHSLKSVILPNTVWEISKSAFAACKNLSEITFGSNLKTINDHAFSGCKGLTSITLPATLEGLEANAFSGCDNLTTVNFRGTEEEWYSLTHVKVIEQSQPIQWAGGRESAITVNYNYSGE